MKLEIGHYYRAMIKGWKKIIVQYQGADKPYHCATCTCDGTPLYTIKDRGEAPDEALLLGPIDIRIYGEVKDWNGG